MEITENIKLAPYTTFKIGGSARFFCTVKDQFDALEAFEFANKRNLDVFVLGGGSNLLISDEGFNGLVARVENKGIEILHEDDSSVVLKIASGEKWDEVVKFAVKNNWWGIENLSHIPGGTGAIAVQNVGAYGQEAKHIIKSVTVFDKETHQILELKNEQCRFGYRLSIFNTCDKGKYIIFYITLKLSKTAKQILSYRDLQDRFPNKNPTIDDIRKAVIEIRNKKYTFPTQAKNGNAGSFFKNPILNKSAFEKLKAIVAQNFGQEKALLLDKKKFDEEGKSKIPAAFLVEISGLKDLQQGGAAINSNQPLVIINKTGKASATDVLNLAKKVIKTVYEKTSIKLSIEPELIGFSEKELNGIMN